MTGKNKPLIILATKKTSQKVLSTYDMKKFQENGVSYIINTFGQDHASPFTGRTVSNSKGRNVDVAVNEDKCFGVCCTACGAISVMLKEQASKKIEKCAVCASALHYSSEDIDTDEDEDGESDDVDFDDIGGDSFDDYQEPDEDSEEDSDEDDADSGEKEDDINMVDAVDYDGEEDELSFVKIDDSTVAAFVNNIQVATLSGDSDEIEKASPKSFGKGIKTVIEKHGLGPALKSAGFKPVVIKSDKALAAAFSAIERRAVALSVDKTAEEIDKMKRCLDIAASGMLCGMFSSKGKSIHATLSSTFGNLNVDAPKKTAARVLSKTLASHNKKLFEIAEELMDKEDIALDTLEEQISEMEPKDLMEEEPETDMTEKKDEGKVEARLSRPVSESESGDRNILKFASGKYAGIFNK